MIVDNHETTQLSIPSLGWSGPSATRNGVMTFPCTKKPAPGATAAATVNGVRRKVSITAIDGFSPSKMPFVQATVIDDGR